MDIYSSITLSASIVALGATALLWVRLVRPTPQHSGLGEIVLILDREFRGPEFRRSENFVLHTLAEDYRGGISGLSPEARGHVCRVGRFYGDAGMVAATGSLAARSVAESFAEGAFAEGALAEGVLAGGAPFAGGALAEGALFSGVLHSRAEAAWAVLQPYVEVERQRRGSTWWRHFENLATQRARLQAAKRSTPSTTTSRRRERKRSKA